MKISGFNSSNWGRKGNDDEDEKNKGKVDDKRKVMSQDDQEGDKDKDKKETKKDTGRRGRNHFDGLGQRMRDGFSDLSSRISARIGSGHGDHIRGRLQDVSQRAVGLGRNANFFTGLSLIRAATWIRNAAHNVGGRVSNAVHNIHTRRGDGGSGGSSDPKSRISGPVEGTFVHTAGTNGPGGSGPNGPGGSGPNGPGGSGPNGPGGSGPNGPGGSGPNGPGGSGPNGPGGSGPNGPGGGIDPNMVNPIPKPIRTFEYKGDGGNGKPIPAPRTNRSGDGGNGKPIPAPRTRTGSNSSTGSNDSHPIPPVRSTSMANEAQNISTSHVTEKNGSLGIMGGNKEAATANQYTVSPEQLTKDGLGKVASEVLARVSSSGGPGGSPYLIQTLPSDGTIGEQNIIVGSPLTLRTGMSYPAERTQRFLSIFRDWVGGNGRAAPAELGNQAPAEMRELQQRGNSILRVLPEVIEVGNFRDGSSIERNIRVEVIPGVGVEERFGSEPVMVRLGDPTPFRDELDTHHRDNMSQVRRFLASTRNPFSSHSSPISIASSENGFPNNIRRLFGGVRRPEDEIQRRMERLTPAQRTELGNQAASVVDAVRLLGFGGPSLTANIYFPDDGDSNTMPRVVLGGFDHVVYESEVGAGGISPRTYEESRSRNLSGALYLRNFFQ